MDCQFGWLCLNSLKVKVTQLAETTFRPSQQARERFQPGVLAPYRRICARLASLEHIEAECWQVQRQCEEARNTATKTIRIRDEALLALQDSEQQYRDLTEALPQFIWLTRSWHVYFNQKWCEYTAMTLEKSYGHGWNHAFHPDDRQRVWNRWKQATETGEAHEIDLSATPPASILGR
jgi:PAS domain-containing protein